MAGHFNTVGNTNFLKQKFTKNIQSGEKLKGYEFQLRLEEFPDVEVLVRTTQIPAMGREVVEDFGQNGLKFTSNGALKNSGEITITVVETITGTVLSMIRNIVKNNLAVTAVLETTPESLAGKGAASQKFRLEHCYIESDAIDLSTEDTTAAVKPSMTLRYNWFDL